MIAQRQTPSPILDSHGRPITRFGYDAVASTNRRTNPKSTLFEEDKELDAGKRRKLVSTGRDVMRNFAVARWMVSKHLDFVASFNFGCRTGDQGLDRDVEALIKDFAKRENFDVAARHPLRRALRIAEARAVIDGDIGAIKLASGHLQWIESDRVRDPRGGSQAPLPQSQLRRIKHGVLCDAAGGAISYAVHRRTKVGFEFERMVPAANMLWRGYYDRFDQVRGISPLAAGLNSLKDTYESFDYALAKAKVAQLFGLAIYREASESAAPIDEVPETEEETDPSQKRYEIDFGKGPVYLELDPGDRAEFLENKTPSVEFKDFTTAIIAVVLKAIDLPFSFYDEAHTNFFGSRSALLLYLKSAKCKREDNRDLLDEYTQWRLGLAIADGALTLPRTVTFEQLIAGCKWTPDGIPWWDPSKEIRADIMAIAAGLRTRAEIRLERFGDDWFDVIDRLAEEEAHIRDSEVTITEAAPSIFDPEPVMASDDAGN